MADPTWFNWLADVVAPTVLGIGAIAVGFASWKTARASHKLAAGLEARSLDEKAHEDRSRIGTLLLDVVETSWEHSDKSDDERFHLGKLKLRMAVVTRTNQHPNFDFLYGLVRELEAKLKATPPLERINLSTAYASTVRVAIHLWMVDPDRLLKEAEVYLSIMESAEAAATNGEGAANVRREFASRGPFTEAELDEHMRSMERRMNDTTF